MLNGVCFPAARATHALAALDASDSSTCNPHRPAWRGRGNAFPRSRREQVKCFLEADEEYCGIAENPTSSGRESFSSGVVRETLDHERARSEVSGVGNAQGALELTPRPIPKNTQPKLAFPGVLEDVVAVFRQLKPYQLDVLAWVPDS